MKKKAAAKTPLRSALMAKSSLHPSVKDGLGAVDNAHRNYFESSIRTSFADSIDFDKAMEKGHENDNRWDYLLGHLASGQIVAIEPHSAKQDELSTVIAKRQAALTHLRDHLKEGVRVTKWLWVASGKVQFADTEKARRWLDQNGIEFVGGKVLEKHLPRPALQRAPTAKSKIVSKGKK